MSEPTEPAVVVSMQIEARDVVSIKLRPLDGSVFPPVDPGSHVDIVLPNGLSRSYSLSNGPEDVGQYRLTVARDPASRGGSSYVLDHLRVGDRVELSAPRNNFEIAGNGYYSLFIAGGIGVTPFIPMVARLNGQGLPWRMHYCVRTRDRAALVDERIGGCRRVVVRHRRHRRRLLRMVSSEASGAVGSDPVPALRMNAGAESPAVPPGEAPG